MAHAEHREIALVTGAARRIGRAIAESLARAGYDIVLHASARSLGEARETAASIRARGARAEIVVADLADAIESEGLLARAAAPFGPVTLLVNNASHFALDAIEDFDAARFDTMNAVNLRAPLQLSRAFAAALPDDRTGAIVNIVDQRVWRLNPRYFTYTLTKAALWTATQTMAQAFAPRIRVNAVGPGPTLANPVEGEAGMAREAAAIPLARAVEPGEIADAVLYLARARSVTGQMIAVDGGQHVAWKTPDVGLE
jgi:NAD(P)-dependent dehydrogenase (short-subunit alcohol dehydrogenase family)